MSEEQKLLLDIRKKRAYLQKRLKVTNDSIEKKTIAFSISSYLQIEYSLSKLNYVVDKIGKVVLKRDFLLEKSAPYLEILSSSWNYYLEDLDLDYVSSLIDILSEKNYFTVPSTLNVTNDDLIDIAKQFYQESFEGEIKDKGLELLNSSSILFPSVGFYFSNIIGKNYTDPYFGDTYSFIKRQNNDIDLVTVPHEVFHGIEFKLNPQNVLNSVSECSEAGTYAIEFIFYDFLEQLYGSVGSSLKKIALFQIGFDASLLEEKKFSDTQDGYSVSNFLYLESIIVGYGIYLLYKEDRKSGEEKLMEFLNCNFSRNKIPDYSTLGFSKEKILSLAEQMVLERNKFISDKSEGLSSIKK